MSVTSFVRYTVTAAALFAGGVALADNRSQNAITPPRADHHETETRGNPQGPKNGFPDNDGIRRATERANEHARFLRHDSEG